MALKENEVPQQLYLNVGSTVSRSQYSVLYMGMPWWHHIFMRTLLFKLLSLSLGLGLRLRLA